MYIDLSYAKTHLASDSDVLQGRNRLELLFDKYRLADFGRVVLNPGRKVRAFSRFAQTVGVRLSEAVVFQATRV